MGGIKSPGHFVGSRQNPLTIAVAAKGTIAAIVGAIIGLENFKESANPAATNFGMVDTGNICRLTEVLRPASIVLRARPQNGNFLVEVHISIITEEKTKSQEGLTSDGEGVQRYRITPP